MEFTKQGHKDYFNQNAVNAEPPFKNWKRRNITKNKSLKHKIYASEKREKGSEKQKQNMREEGNGVREGEKEEGKERKREGGEEEREHENKKISEKERERK